MKVRFFMCNIKIKYKTSIIFDGLQQKKIGKFDFSVASTYFLIYGRARLTQTKQNNSDLSEASKNKYK